MADIIIVGGLVGTQDAERRVFADGAVAVEGNRIVAVGPRDVVETAHSASSVIDATGKVLAQFGSGAYERYRADRCQLQMEHPQVLRLADRITITECLGNPLGHRHCPCTVFAARVQIDLRYKWDKGGEVDKTVAD